MKLHARWSALSILIVLVFAFCSRDVIDFTPATAHAASIKGLQKELRKAIKKEDYDRVRAILVKLGESEEPKAAKVILTTIHGLAAPHEVYEEGIQALVQLGSDTVGSEFDKLFKNKKTRRSFKERICWTKGTQEILSGTRALILKRNGYTRA